MSDCIFCKIVKGEVPSTKEAETEHVLAFRNIEPVAEHHVLIIPKNHIESVLHLTKEDKEVFFEMAEVAQTLVKEKRIGSGYKLVFNGGRYQSIPHLHWHLLAGKLEDEDNVLNNT